MNVYTTKEAAYILGVSTATLKGWTRQGKIKAHYRKRPDNYCESFYYEDDIDNCLVELTDNTLLTINKSNERKDKIEALNYLDAKYDELYNELQIIESIRNYLEQHGDL